MRALRPFVLIATGFVAAGALAGCSRDRNVVPGLRPAVDPIVESRESYVRACAPCHGMDGRGQGPVAPALRTPPADLTQLAIRNGGVFPRELVLMVVTGDRDVVAHGTREMPVWSLRFEPTGGGATAAAALLARRRMELLVDHVEGLQSLPPS